MNKTYKILKFDSKTGKFTTDNVTLTLNPSCTNALLAYRPRIFDMILFVVTCKTHKTLLLQIMERNLLFLPNFPFNPSNSWKNSIETNLETLLKNLNVKSDQCTSAELWHIIQIKTSKFADNLFQLIVYVDLKTCTACPTNNDYKWVKKEEVTVSNKELLGPEPSLFAEQNNSATIEEFSYQNEIKVNAKKWNLVLSVEIQENDVVLLFDDFVQHLYPTHYMTQTLFNEFLNMLELQININSSVHDEKRLFNSFCITNCHYITFKDFLLTLVALDKKCLHGSIGGELRTRCIFRYYTSAGSTSISYEEITQIYSDIVKTSKRSVVESAAKATENLYKTLNYKNDQKIPMEKFIELVGSLNIRGTASIYRVSNNLIQELRLKKAYSLMLLKEVDADKIAKKKSFPTSQKKLCKACSKHDYNLAIHSIRINCSVNTNSFDTELSNELVQKIPKAIRENSIELHSSKQLYNDMRQILRQFSNSKYGFPKVQNNKSNVKWDKREDRINLFNKITQICKDSKEIFKKMTRVLKVQSPVYVFGDIHGNFKDLMTYDHLFWKRAPNGFVANSLFLGDYVDRGDNSIECILYLLCLKLLVPNRFHMLRGNHESRPIQQQFTFHKECLEKFGQGDGAKLWESFNSVFDCMPLCAVIDEQIYCAHGGIPTNESRIENLHDVPVPMVNPNVQCKTAWEILWNDPVSHNEYKEFLEIFQNLDSFPDYPKGFLPNIKRGTAYYYSEEALENFLEQNNLSFVIRAHEVIPPGFQFHMNGRLMTIFSCSNYCGAVNEAAVVYIEECKIRVIKIETNKKLEIK